MVLLHEIVFVFFPCERIISDIVPDFIERFIILDDVIMIGSLPDFSGYVEIIGFDMVQIFIGTF
jgi:hypothetical protein